MVRAEIWTWEWCPFCVRAKSLLDERGIDYDEHVMDGKDAELAEVKRRYGHPTVPIILLDGELVGGYRELEDLVRQGKA